MSSTRPLVVYVWLYREWGGAQTYLLGVITRVRARFDVLVVLPDGSSPVLLAYLDAARIPYRCFGPAAPGLPSTGIGAKLRARWRKLTSEIAFARFAAAHLPQARIFHCDIAPWLSWPLFAWLVTRGRAVVMTLHTALTPPGAARTALWGWRLRWLDRRPRFRLIAANADVRDSLAPLLPADRRARVPLAYSFVDLDEAARARALRPDRAALQARLGIPADRCLLVVLGQFIERKGHRTLLRALAALDASIYTCLWISTTPADDAARALIVASGAGDRFRLATQTDLGDDRVDLLATIAAADLFLMPSLQEGLPLALVEAMALGVPVIASRINAIPEAIEHGVDGWLTPAGDAGALAGAIAQLWQDEPRRLRLAVAGRRKAERMFDLRATAAETMRVYDAVLMEPRA